MTLFQAALQNALIHRKNNHTLRSLTPVTRHGKYLHRHGKPLLDISSNDYLGLASHPLLKQRAMEWTDRYGTGAQASRLVTGSLDIHHHIEQRLAAFKQCEAALLFASGWQANASLIPALCHLSRQETGHTAHIYMDRLNHASLHQGCMSAGVRQKRFRHNDLAHLEELLHRDHHLPGLHFIITESVFSMDGDRADIPALRRLADHFGAFLYIDEAHATGVLGPQGRGLSQGMADITMSTASKALGGMGAFVTGSKALCEYLLNQASGFIYSTALPPSVLGALDAALDIIPDLDQERHTLQKRAQHLRRVLNQAGYSTNDSSTHIIPIIIGESDRTLTTAQSLEEAGILTAAIRPPTVPPHTGRLRLALHTRLRDQDVHHLSTTLLTHLPLEGRI